ncbi:MAG: efflux RND transporter periplasmic adaptor subunit [Lachnospiraceae bacterium]|nr:efflux RND transporter periplasmic adaptor subunit [Lachnospiraceae bacterium]
MIQDQNMAEDRAENQIEIIQPKEEISQKAEEGKKKKEKKEKAKKEKVKKEKKPMDKAKKKKIRRIVIAAVIVVIILYFVISSAIAGSTPMPVTTVSAETGEIEQTINTSGTVTTNNSKSYFSDVKAKIGKVNVSAGDAVKAGDVLIEYDEASLETEKQLAELSLKSGEGSYRNSIQSNNEKLGDLNEANINIEVLDQQIADTEAYITGLENKIEKKKSDLAYFGTLLQISLLDWQNQPDSEEYMNLQKQIQLNTWEQSNNEEIKGWEAELDVYNKMLSDYKEYRSEMKSQKSSAEAGKLTSGAKEELEADSQTKEIEAQETIDSIANVENGITADFDGVVTEMNAVEGAALTDGTQLLKLESTEDVSVKISVTKYDLDKIKIGQKAAVTIGAKTYDGEVSKINKMAEQNASGAAVVGTEIKLLNPDSDVYLGVEAKVVISTAKETDSVIVPVSAVNVDVDGEFVYVVRDGILVKQPVVTGISSDTMIQIIEGVDEGDRLVTDVTTGLVEGMAVTAM